MEKVFVRKAMSKKTGKQFVAIVVKYEEGQKEKLCFMRNYDYCELLNLSPAEFASLECGDYPIK